MTQGTTSPVQLFTFEQDTGKELFCQFRLLVDELLVSDRPWCKGDEPFSGQFLPEVLGRR
jgi:hypothetical protein